MNVLTSLPHQAVSCAQNPGAFSHTPVLLDQVMSALDLASGRIYVDATFGAGGYTRALLQHDGTRVLALDRDPTTALIGEALCEAYPGRLTWRRSVFSQLAEVVDRDLGLPVDGVVFDIGLSSMQLETPERGFSFQREGPLDMRMGLDGVDAAAIVATFSSYELADLFIRYGEEHYAHAIARAIVTERAQNPIRTTTDLALLVSRVAGKKEARRVSTHPATRVFQALRIAVNQELDELRLGLQAAQRVLRPGGRLVVVSFHSLEDRIVKRFLQSSVAFQNLTRSVVRASDTEVASNPRARSAKLRSAQRLPCSPSGKENTL